MDVYPLATSKWYRMYADDDNSRDPLGRSRSSSCTGISWVDVTWLMLSDIVGTSVLTFAGVSANLGWVLSVVLIVGLFPLSFYVSTLMTKTRHLLVSAAQLTGEEPKVQNMGAVAGSAFRSEVAGTIVCAVVYGYTFLGQASYLLVLGTTAQKLFYDSGLCLPPTIAVSCLIALVPVTALRRLGESVMLCMVNTLLIITVVVIALVNIGQSYSEFSVDVYAFAPGLSLSVVLGQATNVVYSYAGQWMYFELMDTMDVPNDFPRAFAITGPLMVCTYLAVALISLFFGVTVGDITSGMPFGPWLQIASALLYFHVLAVYVIKSIVLQRYLHQLCSPSDMEARSVKSYAKHGAVGGCMLLVGYIIANAVPFFSQLMGLIGGLFSGPVNFILPILMYLAASGRNLDGHASQLDVRNDVAPSDGGWKRFTNVVSGSLRAISVMPFWEVTLIVFIVAFISLTMVLGVSDVVHQIMDMMGTFGAPFACHPFEVDTQGTRVGE